MSRITQLAKHIVFALFTAFGVRILSFAAFVPLIVDYEQKAVELLETSSDVVIATGEGSAAREITIDLVGYLNYLGVIDALTVFLATVGYVAFVKFSIKRMSAG